MGSPPGLSGWHPNQVAHALEPHQKRPQLSTPLVQGQSSQIASQYPQPTSQKDMAISSSSAPADVSTLSFTAVSSPLPSAQSLPASTLAPQNSRPLAPAESPTLSEPPPTATSTAHPPPRVLEQHPVHAAGHHQGPQEEQPCQFRHEAASRSPSKPAASSAQPASATLGNQTPLHTDPVAVHTTQSPPAESQTEQQPASSQAVAATAHLPTDQGPGLRVFLLYICRKPVCTRVLADPTTLLLSKICLLSGAMMLPIMI